MAPQVVPHSMAEAAKAEADKCVVRRNSAPQYWSVEDQEFFESQLDLALRLRP